jgi:hypothetical protein
MHDFCAPRALAPTPVRRVMNAHFAPCSLRFCAPHTKPVSSNPHPFVFSNNQAPRALASVARLAVHQLGSPLWCAGDDAMQQQPATLICRFLLRLRSLLRRSCAVAIVTLPVHLLPEPAYDRAAIERVCVCPAKGWGGTSTALSLCSRSLQKSLHLCAYSCDTVVQLEAFAGTRNADNLALKDYHGVRRRARAD